MAATVPPVSHSRCAWWVAGLGWPLGTLQLAGLSCFPGLILHCPRGRRERDGLTSSAASGLLLSHS